MHMHGYLCVYVCLCVLYLRDLKKGSLREMFIVLKSDVFLKCICMDKLGVYSSVTGPTVEFNGATADADCEWRLENLLSNQLSSYIGLRSFLSAYALFLHL